MCPHGSATGSSRTLKHTALQQLGLISGSRARLCPALLEAALPSLLQLVAPLVRTMVRARLSSHTAWEACRGLRHSSQEERLVL